MRQSTTPPLPLPLPDSYESGILPDPDDKHQTQRTHDMEKNTQTLASVWEEHGESAVFSCNGIENVQLFEGPDENSMVGVAWWCALGDVERVAYVHSSSIATDIDAQED